MSCQYNLHKCNYVELCHVIVSYVTWLARDVGLSPTWLLFGLTRSEKTSVMTTPKCLGAQIWQIYLRSAGRSTPPVIEPRCLEYCYTKLGRSHLWSIEHRCLEYSYTKLGRSTGAEGVLRERPFTRKGNYLVFSVKIVQMREK